MMSKRPLLSICIPTYNRAPFLRQALESYVNNEAFDDDIEIIISDNASTDNTHEIATDFASKYPNIKYYRNEENIRDSNFPLSLDRGSGYYLKLENDNILMNEEGLQYFKDKIRKFLNDGRPLFFTDGVIFNHKKEDEVFCASFDDYIQYVSFYVTAIGIFGAWKRDWNLVKNRALYTPLMLNQDDWSYQIMAREGKAILCTHKFGHSIDVGVRTGYNWFQVHVDNYYKILQPYIDRGLVSRKSLSVEHRTTLNGIKIHVVAKYYPQILPLYQFEKKGMIHYLYKNFGRDPFFYFYCVTFPIWALVMIIKSYIRKIKLNKQ